MPTTSALLPRETATNAIVSLLCRHFPSADNGSGSSESSATDTSSESDNDDKSSTEDDNEDDNDDSVASFIG